MSSDRIVDLTDPDVACALGADTTLMNSDWKTIFGIEGRDPPSWPLADRLIGEGAHGVLVLSVLQRGGVNLVL